MKIIILRHFEIQTNHLILVWVQGLELIHKKSGFCYPKGPLTEHKMKRKDWQILLSCLTKLWNMKVTVIPIVVGALRTVPNGLWKRMAKFEIRRIKTIQTTVLWRTVRILRIVQETMRDLLSLKFQWLLVKASVENSKGKK